MSMNDTSKPQRPGIDVAKLIDESPLSKLQVGVIVLCALVALLEGYDIQSMAYVAPVLGPELGINPAALGTIFAAFLVGVVAGGLVLGPVADRIGRRQILIGSTLVFGLGTLATVWIDSMTGLLIVRVITGLGIGGAATIVSLTAEYTPRRLRSTAGMMMLAGIPLGSVAGGLISSALIPQFGWRSVFIVGGLVPLVLAVVLIFALPESIRFLVARFGGDGERVHRIMRKISPANHVEDGAVYTIVKEEGKTRNRVVALFTHGRAGTTVILWIAMFGNFAAMYFLLSWIPSLLTGAGLPLSTAILAGTIFSLGGIAGAITMGRLMDKARRPALVLCGSALLALATIAVLPSMLPTVAPTFILIFVLGIGVVGTQAGIINLSGLLYPTLIRSTGVGWAMGIGRIGSIISPFVGGVLIASGWNAKSLITAVLIPAGLYFVALLALGLRKQNEKSEPAKTELPTHTGIRN